MFRCIPLSLSAPQDRTSQRLPPSQGCGAAVALLISDLGQVEKPLTSRLRPVPAVGIWKLRPRGLTEPGPDIYSGISPDKGGGP